MVALTKYIKEYTGKTYKEPATLFDDYVGRGCR